MGSVDLTYRVDLKAFREASYYVMFLRKRLGIRIAAVTLIAFLIYLFLSTNDFIPEYPIVSFIAVAELIWFLLQLASTERQILRYTRSADSLIGAEYHAKFGTKQFKIEIPSKNYGVTGEVADIPYVFELTHSFLIFINNQQTFIIPSRDMDPDDRMTLIRILKNALGDRFSAVKRFSLLHKA